MIDVTAILGLGRASAGGGYAVTDVNMSSADVTKVRGNEIDYPMNAQTPVSEDGVDHDHDLFVLLLDPPLTITGWTDPLTGLVHTDWAFGFEDAFIREPHVSYLRCALAGYGPGPGPDVSGHYHPEIYDTDHSCQQNPSLWMPGLPAYDNNSANNNGFLPRLTYADYVRNSKSGFILECPSGSSPASFTLYDGGLGSALRSTRHQRDIKRGHHGNL